MAGALYAIVAGLFISIQSIFNVRLSEKAGFWLTNSLVHGSGFIVSLIIFWMVKDGNLHKLQSVNKLYLLGGCMGVVIVFTAMKSVTALNPAYAIAIMLIVQLLGALALESFGWFGVDKVALSANRLIGIGVMIAGVVIFKFK
ncbi:DMT family transporter [Cohnella silvisoli]|uniref:DMT family transporter n=1 Tax=Cohnella silvisoli TaxID=2873699 RepID=A0ABV1KNA0_9BACL|nr:DMT family transporter [Cohnella silvisoli]MCD9020588.1 DMT family transporter [Cohnella silvisoli]